MTQILEIPVMKKIIFAIGDIGGGHKSTSQALGYALDIAYPGKFDWEVVDIFSQSDTFLDWSLKEGYSLSSNKFIWIYALIYYLTDFPWMIRLQSELMGRQIVDDMSVYFKKNEPDLIVSVHPFTTFPVIEARNKAGLDIPVVTVVSDPFTGHSAWYCDTRSDLFVVFSRLAGIRAQMDGVPKEKIFVSTTPVKPQFDNPLPEEEKDKLRKKFKINPEKITVLIAGGGEGLRGSIPIIRALNRFKKRPNILVVCGRNKDMKRRVDRISRRFPNIKGFGFVDFMYELMNLSDMIVLKAGPATIAEGLLLKKPIIINSYVWGQERGNVRFCIDNEVGFYITNPRRVAEKILEIENNHQILKDLKKNITDLKLYNGSHEIANKLAEFLI